jgi:hypothetical protein
MGDLSERDVEDILGGVQPPGRDDLKPVVDLAAWMHASREIEPPPAMRDHLFEQIEGGPQPFDRSRQRSGRRSPAHLAGTSRVGRRRQLVGALISSGRPIASVAAAVVLLVGVILAMRTGDPDAEPGAVTSQPVLGFPDDDAESGQATVPATTAPVAPAESGEATTGTSPTTVARGSDADAAAPDSTTGRNVPASPDSSRAPTGRDSGRNEAESGRGGGPARGDDRDDDSADRTWDDGREAEDDLDGDSAGQDSSSEAADGPSSDRVDSPWWPDFDLSRMARNDAEAPSEETDGARRRRAGDGDEDTDPDAGADPYDDNEPDDTVPDGRSDPDDQAPPTSEGTPDPDRGGASG